jgi:hypothetical protein
MKKAFLLCIGLTLALGLTAWAQDVPTVEIPLGFSMINVHPNLNPITRLTSTSATTSALKPISWVTPREVA